MSVKLLFHIALASDWAEAQKSGTYTISTLGRTLAEEGFIHAAYGDQWPGVRERFYSDVAEPLVLLRIDGDLLDVPVVEEPPTPGATEVFPHIYGPLPAGAVVGVIPLSAREASGSEPATSPTPPAQRPGDDGPSFAALYFREMFINAGLLLLVMALGFGGMALGAATGSEIAPALLGVAGTAAGVLIAVGLHRSRRRS